MMRPSFRTLLLAPVVLFVLFYLFGAMMVAISDHPREPVKGASSSKGTVTVFGASGTAGDGILEAVLADPQVEKIHVITRRSTPRIEQGVASGKVVMTRHLDYLDYSDLSLQMSESDTVYWAIGISSLGADEQTYRRIHVDFPLQFVKAWTSVNRQADLSFHFISSSDISEDSDTMWVREKIRAEKALFGFARDNNLRVIAYRPDYIGPTREQAQLGQQLLYWFFRPVGAAVQATEIGQAMLVLTGYGEAVQNGTTVSTRDIVHYSRAYSASQSTSTDGAHRG